MNDNSTGWQNIQTQPDTHKHGRDNTEILDLITESLQIFAIVVMGITNFSGEIVGNLTEIRGVHGLGKKNEMAITMSVSNVACSYHIYQHNWKTEAGDKLPTMAEEFGKHKLL